MAFTCIFRRVRIEGKISVHGTTLDVFYNALEDLSFDLELWSWNGEIKVTKYIIKLGR